MDNQVKDCTKTLVEAVLTSSAYQRFQKIKKEVEQHPELHKQINEFRRHNFQVQNSAEILDVYDEIDQMSRQYLEFRKNPLVEEYLKSELRVCRMIQEINLELIQSIDLDIEGIADNMPF